MLAFAPAVMFAAQDRVQPAGATTPVYLLRPARVFDGESLHADWAVVVRAGRIELAGPVASIIAAGAEPIELPGMTLLPGLIDAHSHVLLHPYDETPWNDQVLHEPEALRVARAVNHLRATLLAGFTTLRDLGTEGAGYADVGLKQAVEQGIVPGPRLLATTRAIVATGSYAPKGFAPEWRHPAGRRGGRRAVARSASCATRSATGADWIKVYGDYRAGPGGETRPTFSQEEMKLDRRRRRESRGRPVAVHAVTPEGMRRAMLAGAETIEHGDGGTPEIFRLMAERDVALCPTLAAGRGHAQYAGWKKGTDPSRAPPRASGRPSRRRSRPASRIASGAMSASSRTATTRASWS